MFGRRYYPTLARALGRCNSLRSKSSFSSSSALSSRQQEQSSGNEQRQSSSSSTSIFGSLSYAPVLLSLALLLDNIYRTSPADSCGIVGVVGGDDAREFLLEGLTILRNRGYDSAGIASVPSDGSMLAITKFASRDSTADSIDLLRANSSSHHGHHTGIAHTRWATHGGKTDENAHPHSDAKGRIGVVHNGTINNSYDLKRELQSQGVIFRSETDTEVIAQLIGTYLDKGLSTRDATAAALMRCDGSWGLCVLSKSEPDEIVVACNGSPMVGKFFFLLVKNCI